MFPMKLNNYLLFIIIVFCISQFNYISSIEIFETTTDILSDLKRKNVLLYIQRFSVRSDNVHINLNQKLDDYSGDNIKSSIASLIRTSREKIADLELYLQRIKKKVIDLEKWRDIGDAKSQAAMGGIKKPLQDKIDAANNRIDLINKKTGQNKDTAECNRETEKKFGELYDKYVDLESHCIAEELTKIFHMIRDAKLTLEERTKKISVLPLYLQDCLEKVLTAKCLLENVLNIAEKESDALSRFSQELSENFAYMDGLHTKLVTCTTYQLSKASVDVNYIVADSNSCVIKKVSHTN